MQEPRQLYGLGSLVKSVTKGVKKLIKSPVGKGLLLAGGLGLGGIGPFSGLARTGVGQALFGGATKMLPANVIKGAAITDPGIFSKAASMFSNLSTGTKLGLGGAFASYLMSTGASEEEVEEITRDKGKLSIYLKDYFTKLNPNATDAEVDEFVATNTSEYATGGRVGLESGTPKKGLESLSKEDMKKFRNDIFNFQENNISYDIASKIFLSNCFWNLSGVRDLIFHKQEYRYCIGELIELFNLFKFEFLGFVIQKDILDYYIEKFPNDKYKSNLKNWDYLEKMHPEIFGGMYQFWLKNNE